MEERDNLRKNTTVQIESVEPSTIVSDRKYGKSMAVAKALYVNKKKYETARQYFKCKFYKL